MKRPSGSSLHLLHHCPASHAFGQIYTDGEAAQRGKRAAAEKERERKLGGEWAPEVTLYYDVEAGTARVIGKSMGRDYSDLRENEIAMTADAIGESGDAVLILDDKVKRTYEVPARQHAQLRALALAACRASGKDRATVTWIKWDPNAYDQGEWVENYRDSADLDDFELDVIADEIRDSHRAWRRAVKDVEAGRSPNVSEGPWCQWCPARKVCPAKVGLIRAALAQPVSFVDELKALAPEQAGELYARLRPLQSLLHALRAEIEEYAKHDPVPLPDGSVLMLTEGRAVERVVKADVVARYLSGQFSVDVALEACELKASKASIERALKGVSGDSKGVLQYLREAGAIQKVAGEPKVDVVRPKAKGEAA